MLSPSLVVLYVLLDAWNSLSFSTVSLPSKLQFTVTSEARISALLVSQRQRFTALSPWAPITTHGMMFMCQSSQGKSMLISYLQYSAQCLETEDMFTMCAAEIEEKISPFPDVAQKTFMAGSLGRCFPWIFQNDSFGKEGKWRYWHFKLLKFAQPSRVYFL